MIETKIDNDYIATGTHKGASGTTLYDPGADFKSCGMYQGQYIENETQATFSAILDITESTITTSNDVSTYAVLGGDTYYTLDGTAYVVAGSGGLEQITWNTGDTYKIYATTTRGSFISDMVTDLSRGWKTMKKDMKDGWRYEDIDLDRNGENIFGPGQPE